MKILNLGSFTQKQRENLLADKFYINRTLLVVQVPHLIRNCLIVPGVFPTNEQICFSNLLFDLD